MLINPKQAIHAGILRNVEDDNQVQPNAIDFTVDQLFEVDGDSPAEIRKDGKTLRTLKPVELIDGKWHLRRGVAYDIQSKMYSTLPAGTAAMIWTRSTLVRCGAILASGLYDTGYQGHVGCVIFPIGGDIVIEQGARVGQIGILQSASNGTYAGSYNHGEGTHYSHPTELGQGGRQTITQYL